MLIPIKAVHNAALALQDVGDINQTHFEDAYHCKIGLSPDVVSYYDIYFDTEQDASMFIMRWV
jgi:hypothetical protein